MIFHFKNCIVGIFLKLRVFIGFAIVVHKLLDALKYCETLHIFVGVLFLFNLFYFSYFYFGGRFK